jgi:cytochrome c peroxidase
MSHKISFGIFSILLFCSFVSDSNDESLFYIPVGFPKPIYDTSTNPITQDKINLGKALFYDPILSKDNTISCNSCHSQHNAFAHSDHKLSHGINDIIGSRNAPALFNLAWNKHFMLDGAVHHLDAQSLAPISNPIEMNENLDNVVKKLQASKIYPDLYFKAFGDSIVTGSRTLKAMGQFMASLISANSKYDKVIRKEAHFNESEKRGYDLFKSNCASCHPEPLFTNNEFANNGLQPDSLLNDIGRGKITQKRKDNYLFKVPSLRNIEVSYPYMHDGRYDNLQMVLFHYTNNIHRSKTLDKKLKKPLNLNEQNKGDIINFLRTLTDEEFLRNKKHAYPRELLLKKASNR